LAKFGISVNSRAGSFLDSKKIKNRVSGGVRKKMMTFGGFVRREAKQSIRVSKKKFSSPGDPPKARSASSPIRKLIFFAYDPFKKGVVIGPLIFRQAKEKLTAPRLEYGGTHRIVSKRTGKRRVVRYKPRPFMVPAFEQVTMKHRNLFKGIL